MSKMITWHLEFIEKSYNVFEINADPPKLDTHKLDSIPPKMPEVDERAQAGIKKIVNTYGRRASHISLRAY